MQENRINAVGLRGHVTIQSDIADTLVDREYVNADAFSEYVNGVCCPSLKVVAVAVVVEYERRYL
jgi:hypothetical protein